MKLDVKHFQAFVILAKHLHFSKAAEELGVAQPTITLFIKQLEDAVGASLVHRSTRSVYLTDMGLQFLPKAQHLLEEMLGALNSVREFAALQSGKLSVAVYPSISSSLLPHLFVRFQKAYPSVFLRIIDANYSQMLDRLRTGEVDLAIGYAPETERDVAFQPLFRDEIAAFFRHDHAFVGRDALTWAHLAKETLIAPPSDTSVRALIDNQLIRNGLRLQASITATSMYTIAAMVRQGGGVGILPSSYNQASELGDLKSMTIQGPVVHRPIGLIRRKRSVPTPVAEAFVDLLCQGMDETDLKRQGKVKSLGR